MISNNSILGHRRGRCVLQYPPSRFENPMSVPLSSWRLNETHQTQSLCRLARCALAAAGRPRKAVTRGKGGGLAPTQHSAHEYLELLAALLCEFDTGAELLGRELSAT